MPWYGSGRLQISQAPRTQLSYFNPVAICPLRDIGQYLQTFLAVPIQGVVLASSENGPGMFLNIPECTGQPPQQIITWAKVSIVLRLKSPALNIKNQIPNASATFHANPYMLRGFQQDSHSRGTNLSQFRCLCPLN